MKWKDLSFKEKRKIYDTFREKDSSVNYFDIKSQFDSVPAYEDGGKKLPEGMKLPPEYVAGTPEYYKRQAKISGRIESVQPEAYITPAGYIKDAINFVDDFAKGEYGQAALDVALNILPWGIGKGLKKVKSKIAKPALNGTVNELESYVEPFTPTITKKGKKSKVKTEADYDDEFSVVKKKHGNINTYDKELNEVINDIVFSGTDVPNMMKEIDASFGTTYGKAASRIAHKDMSNRGGYVKYVDIPADDNGRVVFGKTNRTVDNPTTIDDLNVQLNSGYYVSGTANHELSHVGDVIVNKELAADMKNPYMEYLLDDSNINYRWANPKTVNYLIRPTENKAHMIQLKRGLRNDGSLKNWAQKVDQNMIENYLSYDNPSAATINPVLRDLYNMRTDKSRFVDRMNRLTPIQYAAPIGFAGFLGGAKSNNE